MRKNNFKIVSLLTVFTIVLNVLSAVVMLQPAKAATTASVTQSSMAVDATSVTYDFTLTSTTGTAVEITFPAAFQGTPATTTTDCSASGNVITCTTLQTSVVVTGVTNPDTVGSYDIAVDFTGDDDVTINAAIVDSDTVNVNGYINTSLTFDLDTADFDDDCGPTDCLVHETGDAGTNYTVDLGNLTTAAINASGDTRLHSDGDTAAINYIWFDLSSNASGGVIVTYVSAKGYLTRNGLAGTPDAWDIPSVDDGDAITLNVPGYGIKFAAAPSYDNIGNLGAGVVTQRTDCTDQDATYCAMPTSAEQILGVNTSVQNLRAQLTVAAAVDGTMPAGTYVDQLTFIATGTF